MPILVFHSPIFICVPLARKWLDKARTMALCFLLLPYPLPTHFVIQTPRTSWRCGKAAQSPTASGRKPPGQVICTTSIPEEPESTRPTGDEPSLSIHTAAWAHHLYLHSSSIKLPVLCKLCLLPFVQADTVLQFAILTVEAARDQCLIAIFSLNSLF